MLRDRTTFVINWDKAQVVDREAQRQHRWIKEALWITKIPIYMNRDAGSYQLSHTWDQVISRSRAPSSCKESIRRVADGHRNVVNIVIAYNFLYICAISLTE